MIEGLRQLVELQQLDDELHTAREEHDGLPARRRELAERREAAEVELQSAKEALAETEGTQRKAETGVQDQQALLQKLEGQQFQVKTNDAYTALLSEIEQAKDAISVGETRVLEAMEAIDEAGKRMAEAEKQGGATLIGVAEQEKAVGEREQQLLARIAELSGARGGVCGRVDPTLLAHYDRIGKRRRPVLARVRGELCLGCRVKIPPQRQIELLRGSELITCSTCHRILTHDWVYEAGK